MRAWCPRCDAVRPGETACPDCGTPLATLEDAAAPAAHPPEPPPPEEPAGPPPRSRRWIALAAATVVVAALAFVAGRSVARPAAGGRPVSAVPATSTTVPEPGANRRELGWTARAGGVTVTAVEASRVATEQRETVASISFRVKGVPSDQRVLALRGLRLLDSGGGVYASAEQRQFSGEGGVPVRPVDGDPDLYRVVTGPAPRLSSLARIDLTGVVAVRARDRTIALDTSGPWPAGPGMRTIDPGQDDAVRPDPGSAPTLETDDLELRVTSAFVRDGRAVVVVDASWGFRGVPGQYLPLGAELRAGDRVLCARTSVLGEDIGQQLVQGIVLSCPARPVPRLTVAVGVGARILPFDATLRP
jgi:hypothetical protein